jgi:hypothetical protein
MTVDLRHDSVNGYLRTHEPFLAARGITKVFPGAAALVNVSLTAGRGEIVGIVGENGSWVWGRPFTGFCRRSPVIADAPRPNRPLQTA